MHPLGPREEAILSHLLRDKCHNPLPARAAPGQARSAGQLRVLRSARIAGHSRSEPVAVAEDQAFRIPVRSTEDILEARRRARELACMLEFPSIDRTLIASTISELGRNIVEHAERGEISVRGDEEMGNTAIVITATDRGPGIRDLRGTLQEGAGSGRMLGLGLPGVRRIMDEFEVVSKPRQGTTVTVKKWKSQ